MNNDRSAVYFTATRYPDLGPHTSTPKPGGIPEDARKGRLSYWDDPWRNICEDCQLSDCIRTEGDFSSGKFVAKKYAKKGCLVAITQLGE